MLKVIALLLLGVPFVATTLFAQVAPPILNALQWDNLVEVSSSTEESESTDMLDGVPYDGETSNTNQSYFLGRVHFGVFKYVLQAVGDEARTKSATSNNYDKLGQLAWTLGLAFENLTIKDDGLQILYTAIENNTWIHRYDTDLGVDIKLFFEGSENYITVAYEAFFMRFSASVGQGASYKILQEEPTGTIEDLIEPESKEFQIGIKLGEEKGVNFRTDISQSNSEGKSALYTFAQEEFYAGLRLGYNTGELSTAIFGSTRNRNRELNAFVTDGKRNTVGLQVGFEALSMAVSQSKTNSLSEYVYAGSTYANESFSTSNDITLGWRF